MRGSTFINISVDKFHEFILEILPKHVTSQNLIDELGYHRFHTLNSYKKDFINEIMNNYYGMHYVGLVTDAPTESLKYKLTVTDTKLCTFFLLKYGN
jgi:hypothetical protein